MIRYPRGNGVLTDWECPLKEIEVGTGRRLHDGWDVAVLSIGPIGNDVEKAIKLIESAESPKQKVIVHQSHTMICVFLKPLDDKLLEEVASRFSRIITIEDGVRNGGLGSAVTEWMSDHGYTPQITRYGYA